MDKTLNKHQMPVYLLPRQHNQLKDTKNIIRSEYGLSIPMTEMLRDSVTLFLKDLENPESLKLYLQGKGLI
ncbi:MAG: hypothetical protein Q8N97_10110 [Methanobacteriaceae archaeon]|nr:hypothetical protein [Methanobacteriaceae archaeon]